MDPSIAAIGRQPAYLPRKTPKGLWGGFSAYPVSAGTVKRFAGRWVCGGSAEAPDNLTAAVAVGQAGAPVSTGQAIQTPGAARLIPIHTTDGMPAARGGRWRAWMRRAVRRSGPRPPGGRGQ
jgi:hypothetical protein